METRNKLNTYIESLAEKNVISIKQLDWTAQYDLELYDYLIELQIGQFKTTGRGTDKDETTAIQIAFSEAVERLVIKEHNISNSSGCAVHLDQAQSSINSRNELIERDCFLCHFYLRSDFRKTRINEKNSLTTLFKKIGITYRNYLLCDSDIHICLNVIFSKSGIILGMGTNNNLEQAIFKAMIESVRQYIHIIHFSNKQTISLDELRQKQNLTFNDHGNLLFDIEYLAKVSDLLRTNECINYCYPQIGFKSTQYQSVILPDLPLVFTKTSNEYLQSLFLGQPHNNLNVKRLNEFKISQDNFLSNLPHPLR